MFVARLAASLISFVKSSRTAN